MAIGLDIGTSAVRAAELESRRGGTPRLIRYGQVALPLRAVVDGDVLAPAVVAEALRELWAVSGLRGRDVAVGLASQRVTVRQLDLPELAEGELADAVRLQAADQLPIPLHQALVDHVVVERYKTSDGRSNVRLLLVAAERAMVERLLTSVTAAKLRPLRVDLDAFALLRSLVAVPPSDDAGLVVDVGASVTKIAVHRGGHPLFVRMVRLGGDAATRQLETELELSWEQAEKSKLDASAAMAYGDILDPDDERARALQTSVHRVITEIRHSLDFFRSQHPAVEVRQVVLSGGASLAPDLIQQLHSELELPVERGQPLRRIDAYKGRGEAKLEEEGPFLAVPVGLALALLS
ncbi:MAG: type IV pilus assembly protein PilM [Actinomycetota bacterium]|nr:type IV pilus assembly protein PilM [Actinomycetota bacterium]